MKPPNFFIVGAPKAGTTALAKYLGTHPQVFMSPVKEPHYFATDLSRPIYVQDESIYLDLFRGATDKHIAVGEASVWYLYSSVAVQLIRHFNPLARIIVMVRNPLELVPSLHSQLLFSKCEEQVSLENALKMQEERSRGERLPRSVVSGRFPARCLSYTKVAKTGEQLERLLEIFPASQVKVILFDDFKTDPRRIYEETLSFLDVPSDSRDSFPRVNENKVRRIKWLGNPVNSGSRLGAVLLKIRHALRLRGFGIIGWLSILNSKRTQRVPLDRNLRRELADVFRADVAKLGMIMDRELSSWLEPRDDVGSIQEEDSEVTR